MNKKTQISQQMFVFLIAIFVFAMILIYGYKAIADLRQRAQQTELLIFEKQIKSDVQSLYGTFDEKKKEYTVPAKKVCFFDNEYEDKSSANICNEAYSEYDPILCDMWMSGDEKNVFVDHPLARRFSLENINMSKGYLCAPIERKKLPLTLEGTGNRVLINGPRLIYESEFDPDRIFTISVDLVPGWNLVSFPLVLDDYSVESAFSSIAGKYTNIIYNTYHTICADPNDASTCDTWKTEYVYPPEFIDTMFPIEESNLILARYPFTEVDHEKAYYVWMDEPGTFTLTGKLPQYVEIELNEGMNGISFISPIELSPEVVFGPVVGSEGYVPFLIHPCMFRYDENIYIDTIYFMRDGNYGQVCNQFTGITHQLTPGLGYNIILKTIV